METIADLAALIARHTPQDGVFDTALARTGLIRSSSTTEPLHTLYDPSCCIVAQGRKRVQVAGRTLVYDPAHYLVVGLDLPALGAVVEADCDAPYLSLRLQLDRDLLAEMLAGEAAPPDRAGDAVGVSEATPRLIDAACRLLHLLDESPADRQALAPLVERELLHRLLTGPQAAMLRDVAHRASRLHRVGRAVEYIRSHYAEPFAIDDLAGLADMSVSTFHAHFKAATAMSPLQFRTRIRLQEARRLMVAEALGAAEAGFRVGYESPSQFSRDYRRLHALPPGRDRERLRA